MNTQGIWLISALSFAGVGYFVFSFNILAGLLIGATIGFVITTTLKLLGWNIKTGNYSSSNSSGDTYYDDYYD